MAILVVGAAFSLIANAHAFRPPEGSVAPLGHYDKRTQTSSPVGPATVSQVRSLLAAARGAATSPAIQVHLAPSTGRPRHVFFLDGRLSELSTKPPAEIARDFLWNRSPAFGLSQSEIAATTVADEIAEPDGKVRHLVLQQRCSGLDVFQGRIQFAMDARGRVISMAGDYYPGLTLAATPRISALEAVQWAAAHCDRTIPRGRPVGAKAGLRLAVLSPEAGPDRRAVFARGPFRDPVEPHLAVMPFGAEGIPAWEMTLHVSATECYHVLVDARDGTLLYRTNLCKFVLPAGLVFTENPDAGPRQVVSFVGDPVASPAGWCDATSKTQGNNAVAREDADGNNEIVPGFQPIGPYQQFIFPFIDCWADQQTTAPDVSAVVTNLFYFVNWYHDYLYKLGFDEASGNFQQNNVGRGGKDRDSVYADALNGSGFNNATFVTLPDGAGHSRLQMFLMKPLLPVYPLYRDSDLDGDIVLHEYTHGMTARMVGGPSNVLTLEDHQAASMAEGWSDFFPCSVFNDPVLGEYVTGNRVRGARHAAYDAHPWTFGAMGSTFQITTAGLPAGGPLPTIFVPEVHTDGEIWAAAMWVLRSELGSGPLAEFLAVEALRYTPVNPTLLEGREAILLADAVKFQGRYRRAIWRAFAQRGIGWSAQAEVGPQATLVFQAFDWPPAEGGSFSEGAVWFADDMEGDLSGWTVSHAPTPSGVAFHPTRHRAASGAKSGYFGREGSWNYDTSSREWSTLESPAISLPAGSGYFLEFKHWRAAEDTVRWDVPPFYFDPGIIYVRRPGTGEYYQVGFAFRNTNGWETRRIDLSGFAGKTIQIGFYFDTWDQFNNDFEGWYLDDVRIVQSRTVNIRPTAVRPTWDSYR